MFYCWLVITHQRHGTRVPPDSRTTGETETRPCLTARAGNILAHFKNRLIHNQGTGNPAFSSGDSVMTERR